MFENKICGVYEITNTVTGDFYIGSSKDIKRRWAKHKWPSAWKQYPNSKLYQDMQKYGLDKFRFQILAPVMEEYLKQTEQEFIDMLKPAYNNIRANGQDVERHKKYFQSEKYKEYSMEYRSQICLYNGETLTFGALRKRFQKAGVSNPTQEARIYLVTKGDENIGAFGEVVNTHNIITRLQEGGNDEQ